MLFGSHVPCKASARSNSAVSGTCAESVLIRFASSEGVMVSQVRAQYSRGPYSSRALLGRGALRDGNLGKAPQREQDGPVRCRTGAEYGAVQGRATRQLAQMEPLACIARNSPSP